MIYDQNEDFETKETKKKLFLCLVCALQIKLAKKRRQKNS